MSVSNQSNRHINYINNIMNYYSESNLNIEKFCIKTDIKEVKFKKFLNEYLNQFYTLTFEESLENSYYIYSIKENFENKSIEKELLGKINIRECFIDTPYSNEEDYKEIDSYILNNKLLILKIKFSNLQYYSIHDVDIFSKIYIFNEDFKFKRSLCNSSLICSKYGENIGYRETYERKYLPKISYNVTLAFSIPADVQNYAIAFKDLYIDGNGIKKIQIETRKSKDLSNREKCPKCNSFDTVKDGKRNGKQRYQCNICKRKFTGK